MNVRPAAASAPKKKVLAYGALLLAAGAAIVIVLEKTSSHPAASRVSPAVPVHTQQTIHIKAPVEKVWKLMSQVNQWAAWQPDINASQLNGLLQPGTGFDWKTGGLAIHSTLHTVEPRAALGWSGTAFGSFAVHNWAFIPQPDGTTEVQVEEGMEGWLVRLLQPVFQHSLDASTARWLACLRQAAERP